MYDSTRSTLRHKVTKKACTGDASRRIDATSPRRTANESDEGAPSRAKRDSWSQRARGETLARSRVHQLADSPRRESSLYARARVRERRRKKSASAGNAWAGRLELLHVCDRPSLAREKRNSQSRRADHCSLLRCCCDYSAPCRVNAMISLCSSSSRVNSLAASTLGRSPVLPQQ